MAELITIARPYAKAAFEYAKAQDAIASWSEFLQIGKQIMKTPAVKSLLNNPKIDKQKTMALIKEIYGKHINQHQENFLAVLSHYRRLMIIPEVTDLFEHQRKEQEKAIVVKLTSAYPVTESQQQKFAKALKIRLRRDVILEADIDNSLIGGALIRAGDFVIDGTVKGQLQRMRLELNE